MLFFPYFYGNHAMFRFCDEHPGASSASPWKQARNTCPSSSQAEGSQLQLITQRLHKPRKPCHKWDTSPWDWALTHPLIPPISPTDSSVWLTSPHWSTARTHCSLSLLIITISFIFSYFHQQYGLVNNIISLLSMQMVLPFYSSMAHAFWVFMHYFIDETSLYGEIW